MASRTKDFDVTKHRPGHYTIHCRRCGWTYTAFVTKPGTEDMMDYHDREHHSGKGGRT